MPVLGLQIRRRARCCEDETRSRGGGDFSERIYSISLLIPEWPPLPRMGRSTSYPDPEPEDIREALRYAAEAVRQAAPCQQPAITTCSGSSGVEGELPRGHRSTARRGTGLEGSPGPDPAPAPGRRPGGL